MKREVLSRTSICAADRGLFSLNKIAALNFLKKYGERSRPPQAQSIPKQQLTFIIMPYQTEAQNHSPPIAIISTAIACTLVGGVAGAHMGMSRNTIIVENAQTTAQQATQDYQSCRAFVESRDAYIDELSQHFTDFYQKTRGQQ